MAELDDDRDEEWFKEVYGREYTGPPQPPHDNLRDDSSSVKKRPGTNAGVANAGDESDEEDERRDPNAVPTDFTSREAKVWEAKAKAVERNWKRRKEEELTCRICGEVGHFAQGCPTTLGGNRKQGEVIEIIPVRDKRMKPRIIGTGGAVIQGIEKESGCRLKLEDNLTAGSGAFFVRISGPDRVAVGKAVDVVNKLVEQVEDEWKHLTMRRPHGGVGNGGNDGIRVGGVIERGGGDRRNSSGDSYRGSAVNPLIAAQMQHIAVQRLQHSAPNLGPLSRGEGPPQSLDEDKRAIEHIASQLEARRQWEAVSGSSQTLNGSGASPPFSYREGRGGSGAGVYSSYGGKGGGSEGRYFHGPDSGPYQIQGGSGALPELEQDLDLGYEEKPSAQTLDELESRFLQETIELTKDQNSEEDKENMKHRERMKEIQEQYQQKMISLRSKHAKQREDFLRHDAQIRQHQYQQHAGYGMYQYGVGNGSALIPSRGGPYNGNGYDRGAHSASPEDIQGLGHIGVYDLYKDGGQLHNNNVSHSYTRKQGFESSKSYGNQGYDSAPYSYGNSQGYSSYG